MKEGIFDNYKEFSGCLELLECITYSGPDVSLKQLDFAGSLLVECEDYVGENENIDFWALQESLEKRITAVGDKVIAAKLRLGKNANEAKP